MGRVKAWWMDQVDECIDSFEQGHIDVQEFKAQMKRLNADTEELEDFIREHVENKDYFIS